MPRQVMTESPPVEAPAAEALPAEASPELPLEALEPPAEAPPVARKPLTAVELCGVVTQLVAILEPLSRGARARVLLFCALHHMPGTLSDEWLHALLEQAKQP